MLCCGEECRSDEVIRLAVLTFQGWAQLQSLSQDMSDFLGLCRNLDLSKSVRGPGFVNLARPVDFVAVVKILSSMDSKA